MKFSLIVIAAVIAVASAEIGSDLFSTLKIVNKLCYFPGDHSDAISKQFFDCYNEVAEDKAKWEECQVEAFGNALDTEEHVDVACRKAWKMVPYVKCMKEKYAGGDMDAATLKINKCQGRIFGME